MEHGSEKPTRPAPEGAGAPAFLGGPDLTRVKTIRLAVSGDVALTRLERRLIDTADYQRLRHIRQLGMAWLVYPTALHTRFDHSLGTLAMTEQMIRMIRAAEQNPAAERAISPEQEVLARLYALLHDITHIPFGHTLEDEFCIFDRHDRNRARIERFLGEGSAIGRALREEAGAEIHARLMRLFDEAGEAGEDHFILDLVDNTIAADLLDYLRRDAYFCNVAIETDYRFLRHLAIVPHEGRRRLVVRLWKEDKPTPRRDVLNELIRLLDNRYLMSERVYYHHTKLVLGSMVAAAVARAVLEGELSEADFLQAGDDVLLWRLGQSRQPSARRLSERLGERALWKLVESRGRGAILAEQQAVRQVGVIEDLMNRFHRVPRARVNEEDRLATLLGMEPADLLVYCPHFQMAMKPADILVFWNGALRPLKDCTDDELIGARLRSILDSHQNLWGVRVFMNPERLDRRDMVAAACDALFTWEPARRKRYAAQFYRSVLVRLAEAEGIAQALTAEARAQKIDRALDTFLNNNESERTIHKASELLNAGAK